MSDAFTAFSLYDWIEVIALLVSLSGVLILGACFLTRTFDRLVQAGLQLPRRRSSEAPLLAAVRKLGMTHLACGGLLLVIAEAMEFAVY